jgi:hypothetical protein
MDGMLNLELREVLCHHSLAHDSYKVIGNGRAGVQ